MVGDVHFSLISAEYGNKIVTNVTKLPHFVTYCSKYALTLSEVV